MSWVRIWIHLVFSTKNRDPYFNSPEVRQQVFRHIEQNAKEKNIWLDIVGGYHDHIHCLLSLGRDQSISKVSQLIKGESSFWVNHNGITKQNFTWQDDYWALSVSESHLETVRSYIQQQEEHHRTKSFTEEVNDFMEKYGWSFSKES